MFQSPEQSTAPSGVTDVDGVVNVPDNTGVANVPDDTVIADIYVVSDISVIADGVSDISDVFFRNIGITQNTKIHTTIIAQTP
jgi:hypothetical protein